MKFGADFEALENDDPIGGFDALSLSQDMENVTVLGKGSRDSVKFEWMISPWSECSQSCAPEVGYKVSYLNILKTLKRKKKLNRQMF